MMSDSFFASFFRGCLGITLAFLLGLSAHSAKAIGDDVAGGVPGGIFLSIGFGEDFSDTKFVNINGMGMLGIVEFFDSDVWLSTGVYANLTFTGDVLNREAETTCTGCTRAPSEGWAVGPGIALGFSIGAIPAIDIHLLGMIGGSFSLLSRHEVQADGTRVKTADMRSQIGYDYGGMIVFSYAGANPLLKGFSLGAEGMFHDNTFDKWHLGFTIGFSF